MPDGSVNTVEYHRKLDEALRAVDTNQFFDATGIRNIDRLVALMKLQFPLPPVVVHTPKQTHIVEMCETHLDDWKGLSPITQKAGWKHNAFLRASLQSTRDLLAEAQLNKLSTVPSYLALNTLFAELERSGE